MALRRTIIVSGLVFFLIFGINVSFSAVDSAADSAGASENATMSAANSDETSTPAVSQKAADYPLTPERYEQLVAYSRFGNIWRFVSFLAGVAVLSIILLTGLSARFRNWAGRLKYRLLVVLGFIVLFFVTDYILSFPFTVYRNFIVESNYGFMNQSFMQWLSDDLLALGISLVILVIPVWFFYWLVRRTRRWWLIFSLGSIPFLILVIVIQPLYIAPLFNDFGPLQDKVLESKILALAGENGINGSDVFEVDGSRQSTKVNAYVTGLFGSKRIVLYDTLIKNFTQDEIMFVMAHEMGHYLMNHIWQGLGVAFFLIVLILWVTARTIQPVIDRFKHRLKFDRLDDLASLPLVVLFLSVLSFVTQPLPNSFSRMIEHQADAFGMQASKVSGDVAASAFEKLSAFNLSDPDPNPLIEFWFYDHPAIKHRIEFVRGYRPPAD
jgi:STE24 endopeptidase